MGHLHWATSSGESDIGHVGFIVNDDTPAAPAFTKAFSFADVYDFEELHTFRQVLYNGEGEPALLVYEELTSIGTWRVLNILGSEMSMPGLLLPSDPSMEVVVEHLVGDGETPLHSAVDNETFAVVTESSIQFYSFDPEDPEAEPTLLLLSNHGDTIGAPGGGVVYIKWLRLYAEAGVLIAHYAKEEVTAVDTLRVWTFDHLTDSDDDNPPVLLNDIELTPSYYRSTNENGAGVGLGAEHLFVGDIRGIRRYPISATGVVDDASDDGNYLDLPGSYRRDLTRAKIECSRVHNLCVATHLNEVLVFVHSVVAVGDGVYDAMVTQAFTIENRTFASYLRPHQPEVSFSPDGEAVILVTNDLETQGMAEESGPSHVHLYQVNAETGVLHHKETLELDEPIYGGFTWRDDGRSVSWQFVNGSVVDWTLYPMADPPVLVTPSRITMYNEFALQVAVDEMCTAATVTIDHEADDGGDQEDMTTIIMFTDVMPDSDNMITFVFDPCMLDSTTSPNGVYAGITGASKITGMSTFTISCTTPTGQTQTTDPMDLGMDCQEQALSREFALDSATAIIVMTVGSGVILGTVGTMGVQLTRPVAARAPRTSLPRYR